MRLLGLLVERLNTFGWLVNTECYGLPVSRLWVGLGRRRLGHLFGYLPILYQFKHSRSFVMTLKKMTVNDEWQVLTTIILMLTCQCHEIINQESQFVAWIEAGTSRNRTHSPTFVNHLGWKFSRYSVWIIMSFRVVIRTWRAVTISVFLWHHTQHLYINPFLAFITYLVFYRENLDVPPPSH